MTQLTTIGQIATDIDRAFADLMGRGVDFRDEPHLVAKMPDHEL